MKCTTEGCEGKVEANVKLGLSLDDDGNWSLTYVGDDHGVITCDAEEHENMTQALGESLSAFLDQHFPGLTWATWGPVACEFCAGNGCATCGFLGRKVQADA